MLAGQSKNFWANPENPAILIRCYRPCPNHGCQSGGAHNAHKRRDRAQPASTCRKHRQQRTPKSTSNRGGEGIGQCKTEQ
eukprot:3258004-Lingulodinium_polyedra.AAC.1